MNSPGNEVHATHLARQAARERFDKVVAVGGDGTVNETARGLLHTQTPLAILPNGSGNGLARHLRIPLSIPRALRALAQAHVVRMDTVLVNGHVSVNVSGIGFDGHVAGLFGKDGKRGFVGYARLTLREFISFQEFTGTAVMDGEEATVTAFLIAIANSSQFGNNARIAPEASICDGWLDVSQVKKVPFAQSPGFARRMFSGTLGRSRFVTITQAKNIHFSFTSPVAYHVDGEPHPAEKEFDIRIVPGSLSLLVPNRTLKV